MHSEDVIRDSLDDLNKMRDESKSINANEKTEDQDA